MTRSRVSLSRPRRAPNVETTAFTARVSSIVHAIGDLSAEDRAAAQAHLRAFRAERKRALEEMDAEWMRRIILAANPGARPDPETLVIHLHKHRYFCREIDARFRHESGAWLRARGFTECWGMPMVEEGRLPR